MKLLIDIPDWLYQHIVDFGVLESDEPELYWAIYKGQKVLAEDIIKMKNLVEENKED